MSRLSEHHDGYRGIRVAVLGASGFIGRWVARALCNQEAKVYLLVRNRSVAANIFSEYCIRGEICVVDLTDSGAVFEFFKEIRPSITFNLAGYGVDPTEDDEESAYQMNANLLKTICDAVAKSRDMNWSGQEIVHVGSALEYGAIRGNLREDSVPNPTTLYGKSKLAGTNLLTRCCESQSVKGLTARLFTVYGPGEHRGRLLPALLETAATGDSLSLTAGKQKRDFTYVEDVAEGLVRLGLAAAKPGEIVNLATGRLTSVREFVETAAMLLHIPDARLKFGALATRVEEMEHAQVTIARLRKLTGWFPSIEIVEGVRKTVEFERA